MDTSSFRKARQSCHTRVTACSHLGGTLPNLDVSGFRLAEAVGPATFQIPKHNVSLAPNHRHYPTIRNQTIGPFLFPNAKLGEYRVQVVFAGCFAGNEAKGVSCGGQVHRKQVDWLAGVESAQRVVEAVGRGKE